MTDILVVANQKGGVGKTTTVINSAYHFAKQGKKVLIVDFDGQGNASTTIGDEYSLGVQAKSLFEDIDLVIPEPESAISLLSADISLNDVESLPIETIIIPRTHLSKIKWPDLIIIDTPPSLGRRLLGALVASDFVLTPMDLSRFSSEGLHQLLETIKMIKNKFNPNLQFLGVLPNKVNTRSTRQKETLGNLYSTYGEHIIPQMVANRASVADSIDDGKPVSAITTGAGRKAASEFKLAFEFVEEKMTVFSGGA